MEFIGDFIVDCVPMAWVALLSAFVLLAKCADIFVDSSVHLAERLKIPKFVIGILLVSMATTAPEFSVSMMAAMHGKPEIAMGNAVGSVICNTGLAMGLAGIVAFSPVLIGRSAFRGSAIFLLGAGSLAFLFVFRDATLNRIEGLILAALFLAYAAWLFHQHRKGRMDEDTTTAECNDTAQVSLRRISFTFAFALTGIVVCSKFIIWSANSIALSFHMPESVIALTMVAFGTSVPEVATCITAVRKGHGSIAVGNVLGANIMNICLVAGAASMVRDLVLTQKEIFFMFPVMFILLVALLGMLRWRHRLTRSKGIILLVLYAVYLVIAFVLFPPTI